MNNTTYFVRGLPVFVQISHVYLGLIISVGLSGNFLCVLMFASKALRRKSPSQYLAALAIADMGFLGTVLITWLKHYDVPVYNGSKSCKFINYISYVCCFLSGWLICAFTFERFVIVFYPLYRNRLCTATRARMIVAGLVVIAMVENSWVIVGSQFRDNTCSEGGGYGNQTNGPGKTFYLVFTSLDSIITVAIPLGLIAVLNSAIAWQIAKSSKLRQVLTFDMYTLGLQQTTLVDKHSTYDESEFHIPSQRRNTRASMSAFEAAYIRKVSLDPLLSQGTIKRIARLGIMKKKKAWVKRYNERRITVVLVTVSMCYLILNLPGAINRLVLAIAKVRGIRVATPEFEIFATFATMAFYTQYSINFFLYSCQGRLYRNVKCVRGTIKGARGIRSQISSGNFRPVRFSSRMRRRISQISDNILPSSITRNYRMQQRASDQARQVVNDQEILLQNKGRRNCKYSLPANLPRVPENMPPKIPAAQLNRQIAVDVFDSDGAPTPIISKVPENQQNGESSKKNRKVSIDPRASKVVTIDRQLM